MIRLSALTCLIVATALASSAQATEEPAAKATAKPAVTKKPLKINSTKGKRVRVKRKSGRQKWPVRRPKNAGESLPKIGPAPYVPGERLLYDVKMLGAQAGQAILAVGAPVKHAGRKVLPIVGFIRSGEFLNKFYPVENRMVVLLDERSLLPLKTDFYIKENGKALDYHTSYDQRRRLIRSVRKKGGKTLKRNFTSAGKLYEPLGSIYAARRMDLKPGDRFDYFIWDGRKERHVTVHAVGVERVWTQMGWIESLRIEMQTTVTGGFIKKGVLDWAPRKGTIWIATDEFRTPVKMISPTKLGDAEAVLVRRYHEPLGKDGTLSLDTPSK